MARKIDLNSERLFENRKASGEGVRKAQSKFYWATSLHINEHKNRSLSSIRNKVVLEIGCASGYDATAYCKSAKSYLGLDISDVAVKNCKSLLIPNADFVCVDGHTIPVQNNSFDCVIVNSLLHHLDLEVVFAEIKRVLKPNGLLIFREPLGINPMFQFYRLLTPRSRTSDERPFSLSDINLMKKYFEFDGREQFFGFFSILSAFVRNDRLRRILTQADDLISKTPFRYFFWQFSGILKVRD
jgi:SAM-dependent methyltransferase